jgi:HD-like signal output (HDOD) protein
MHEEQRIQAILASGIKIPPMPEVLLRLNRLLRDPDAGPAELAALIGNDGALSGAVFRLVGSPVFGLRAKVDSLPRAIALLGMKNTAALLHSESMRAALSDPQHAKALHSLWNRGAAIAELCVIAVNKARLRDINPDVAYMLGMFHDCGLALLCKRFPAYAQALAESQTWPDIPALDHQQQVSHAVMGQMVAKNWALPEDLVLAIRHHHELGAEHEQVAAELNEPALRLCAVLNLATLLHEQQFDATQWSVQQLKLNPERLADLEDAARNPVADN